MNHLFDRREFCAETTGQSLVEFSLNLFVLLLVTFGIIDLGRVVFVNTMLSAAAQAGARAGTVATANSTQIEAVVQDELAGVRTEDVTIVVDRTDEHTEVELTYVFVPATPFITLLLPDGSILLQQSAQMRQLGVSMTP